MKGILFLTVAALCLYGCKGTMKGTVEHVHAHEAVEHVHEGHEHGDAHDHEKHEHGDAHDHEEHGHDHAREEHGDEIIFTREQAARTEFEVKEVTFGTFRRVIKTTGQVLPAPGDEAVVVATTGGIVTYANQNLAAGYAVKKDDKLFNINTKNLGEGDYYARVNANYEKALAAYRRAQGLLADKIVSKREYEAIQLEFRNAKIAYDAIAGQKTPRGVRIVSPMGGYVKNVLVKDGEYVTEGQAIATVSQNRRLVLRADVSEKYFSVLKSIRTANFRTPYDNRVYELEELSGKLLSVGKAASDNTFFVPVSFEFDNCGEVSPGSFVEVFLISSPMERVVSIPVSALTNEMGYFYVYKQLDEEGYRKQEVVLGANDGRHVQVVKGLKRGDRVVTKGAYQVKMASASAAIPGHTHNH